MGRRHRPPHGEPLTGHTRMVAAVAFGRIGDRDVIVSGSLDDTVRVWDAATGQPRGEPLTDHTGDVLAVAIGRIARPRHHRLRRLGRHGAGVGRRHRPPHGDH